MSGRCQGRLLPIAPDEWDGYVELRRSPHRGQRNRHSWAPLASQPPIILHSQLSVTEDHFEDNVCRGDRESVSPRPSTAVESPSANQKKFLSVDNGVHKMNAIGGAIQKRIQFLHTRQRSMGHRESLPSVLANGESPTHFSASFDSGCASAEPPPGRRSGEIGSGRRGSQQHSASSSSSRQGPIRADSATSEESVSETSNGNSNKIRNASSSSSLHSYSRKTEPQKLSKGNRSLSTASKGSQRGDTATPPKLNNATKVPQISPSSQAIIMSCMENARADIAGRILQRMIHKRDDFSQFCMNLSHEQYADFANSLKEFLTDVVKHLRSAEKIREISMQFGIKQVPKRGFGFKADFFAAMANALTTECVFLDGAAHQPTDTIEAWAELVELMFSNVRDGYYQQIRYMRRNSHCFNSMFSQSSDQSSEALDRIDVPGSQLESSYRCTPSPNTPSPFSPTEPIPSPGVVIRF